MKKIESYNIYISNIKHYIINKLNYMKLLII